MANIDSSDIDWLQRQIDKTEERINSLETTQHSICIFLKRFILGKKVKCNNSFKLQETKWGNKHITNGDHEGIVNDMDGVDMIFDNDIICDISRIEKIYD